MTTTCQGAAAFRGTNYPFLSVTLYNVPSGAWLVTISGSATVGNLSTPFSEAGTPDTKVAGVWNFPIVGFTPNAYTTPQGIPATIAFSWTDGLGASGVHSQLVGVPVCSGPMSPRIASGMATDSDGGVYWAVTTDGSVGLGHNYGDMSGLALNAPMVGMAALPDGHGYWLLVVSRSNSKVN